jgi:RNA polymerase-associated protein RTF1
LAEPQQLNKAMVLTVSHSSSTPGSPASLGSDAMDESDSDADASAEYYFDTANDDNPYPLEGKYKNAADKEYVLGLTEVEREQVLAEREEEAAAKRRELQLKSLLDSKDREAEKSRKRKAAVDLDDERRPSRAKTSRDKILDAYKTQREQAKEGGRRRQVVRGSRRSRSRSRGSSRDASGEPDDEYPTSNSHQRVSDLPIDLNDIERIRVGRSRLAKVCFFPGFDETMIGCFVRVCIGQDAQTRQNEYRMAVIKAIVTGSPYLVDAAPVVQPFYTDQYVMLAHGQSQKQWSFMHCSDSKFTEREFNRWKNQVALDKVPVTAKTEAEKICSKIHALLDHHLTSEEINEKIAKRDKYKHLFAASTASTPKRTQSNDVAEKLRLRNEKTRRQNAEDVRKALIAEKAKRQAFMKAQHERAAAQAVANNDAAATSASLAVPKSDIDTLFSEGSDISRAASPAVGSAAPAVQNANTSTPGTNTPKKKGLPAFTKMTMDDDIISGMDLAIDIEI